MLFFSNRLEDKPEIEEWIVSSNNERRKKQLDTILSLNIPENASILDIGGKSYVNFFKNGNKIYRMIDLEENRHEHGDTFDGKHLPYPEDSFDLIILSYVLHHASDYSLGLLEQASRITRGYILLAEDLAGIGYPRRWLDRCRDHEPGGVFRSQIEWESIFKVLGLKMIRRITVRRSNEKLDPGYIYRINWILQRDHPA